MNRKHQNATGRVSLGKGLEAKAIEARVVRTLLVDSGGCSIFYNLTTRHGGLTRTSRSRLSKLDLASTKNTYCLSRRYFAIMQVIPYGDS